VPAQEAATSIPPTAVPPTAVPPTNTVAAVNQPSITPPATLTSLPASPTAVSRKGNPVQAAYLKTQPVLDGVWDEWNTTAYPATFITYGYENFSGKEDLEASYRIGWDENYLYLAVKVIDDKYVQNSTKEFIYMGDSIELLLDTNLYGDFYTNVLSPDDFQLGISPGNPNTSGTKEAYLWFPNNIAGSRPEVKIASVGGDGVYRIESFIPWSVFGITPSANARFGFVLSASDNDISDTAKQESMVSSISGRRLLDPTTWGELVLIK
jgi:hypothetical protein